MKKQLLAALLVLTAVTAPFAKSNFACAAETTSSIGSTTEDINNETKVGQDVNQSKESTYSSDITTSGIENVEVYASQGSSFSVMIPKVIILDGVNGKGAYSVAVKGNIAGNQSIHVDGPDSFKLSEQTTETTKKSDITAQLEQVKNTWNQSEINKDTYTYTTGAINAADISAGLWKGVFNFTISLT
jgi:hypothetical protein